MNERKGTWTGWPGRVLLLAGLLAAVSVRAEAPALVVAPFDLIDDHPDPARAADQERRLSAIRGQFVDGVESHGLYRVAAPGAAADALARLRAQREFLYDCPPCKTELGKAAGVRLVAVGWVQKVSNLILNINVEISDAGSGRVVFVKSVDIRGNTDESWMRGMRFLVRELAERGQAGKLPGG
ncbi:DUF3280 domain-containing protein [Thauera sinica]|uniref:DUF3280 domain-containing protein n=1 Tax=Thauera sinica TaxID=2665146 RepID=A0ABW1ALA6_9RHOO|nr:DUF3280 domain-containing protein [Thauera sp. K11]ATE60792.1 hypothetical protein CCZ27_13320 [Thauera sp. K11]